jgi:hypothetical protein
VIHGNAFLSAKDTPAARGAAMQGGLTWVGRRQTPNRLGAT